MTDQAQSGIRPEFQEWLDTYARRKHTISHVKSFVPKYSPSLHCTAMNRALKWLLPWEAFEYPGIIQGSCEALPGLSMWSILAYRKGTRRTPPHVARALAEIVRAEVEKGKAVLAELEEIAAQPAGRKRSGFMVVRDRGEGVPTDKRRRGRRV